MPKRRPCWFRAQWRWFVNMYLAPWAEAINPRIR